MEKVIFDTNFLLEKRMKNFFGKQDQLQKFASVSEIIIPDIVMGELSERYKRDFAIEKGKFFKTLLTNILNHDADEVDIDSAIEGLIVSETISFSIIELSDPTYLYKMKELALKKSPPFVPNDGSDKGFKDAYIYCTVLEYLQDIDDKYVFFVTDDSLLKEAFERHPNVYVVKNFDEFIQRSISTLYDDYFIAKLQTDIDESITKEEIIDYWVSIKDNQILLIQVDEDINYIVEVDSGEIVSWVDESSYKDDLENLITSGSYANTISLVRKLKRYIEFFTEEEIIRTLTALVENSQIRGTVGAGVYTSNFMKLVYVLGSDKLDTKIIEQIPEGIKQG